MMALLKLVDNLNGIDKIEYRDQLYYNKFLYRVKFILDGSRYTWFCADKEMLAERLNEPSSYSSKRNIDIAKNNIDMLSRYIDWRNDFKEKKLGMIRLEAGTVAIFSNDLAFLKTVESIDTENTTDFLYTEARANTVLGIKYFVKDPEYNYRIYLKSKKIDRSYVDNMRRTLNNSASLYPSKALKKWLEEADMGRLVWKYQYSSGSHYIDYNDESMMSYMILMVGDMFGKKFKLEKHPDTIH